MHSINYCVEEVGAEDLVPFCIVHSAIGFLPTISLVFFGANIFLELLKRQEGLQAQGNLMKYGAKMIMIILSLCCSAASLLVNMFALRQIALLPTLISLFWTLDWIFLLIVSREEHARSLKSSMSFKIFIFLFWLCYLADSALTLEFTKLGLLFTSAEDLPLVLLGLNTIILAALNIFTWISEANESSVEAIDYLLMDGNQEETSALKGEKNDIEGRSTRLCSSSLIVTHETPIKGASSGRNSISSSKSSGSNGKQQKINFDANVTEDATLKEYLKFREKTRRVEPFEESPRKAEKSKSSEDLRKLVARPSDGGIEEISVVDFEEAFNKKILYTIKYTVAGKEIKTKKRFSQIRSLYKMLRRKFVNEEFPLFPPKVAFKFIEKSKLVERRELLDGLMKYLQQKHSTEPILINFLETKSDTGSDSTVNSKDSNESAKAVAKASNESEKASSESAMASGESVKASSEPAKALSESAKAANESAKSSREEKDSVAAKLKTKEGITKEVGNETPAETIQSSTKTIVKNNGSLVDTRKHRFSLTDNLIKNYTDITQDMVDHDSICVERSSNKRSSVSSTSGGRHYKVVIEGARDKASEKGENKKQIFYDIQVIDSFSGDVMSSISRRYSEFKTLHKSLKSSNSRRKSQEIPELPFKGKVGIFVSRNDPKVIEYRKFALKSYLQALVNDQVLQNSSELLKFLEVGEL